LAGSIQYRSRQDQLPKLASFLHTAPPEPSATFARRLPPPLISQNKSSNNNNTDNSSSPSLSLPSGRAAGRLAKESDVMSLYFVRFSLPSPLVSPQKACSPNADPYSLSPPHGLIQMPAILLPDQQKSITDQSQQVTDLLVSEAKTWSEEKTKLESRKNEVSLALPSPPPTTPHKLAIRRPPASRGPASVWGSLSLSPLQISSNPNSPLSPPISPLCVIKKPSSTRLPLPLLLPP
jgi:hypothetical protein